MLQSHNPDLPAPSERIILGIDPGTNIMGYGVLLVKSKKMQLLDMGVFRLEKLETQQDKLQRILEETLRVIDTFHPDEMAVEAPFFGKNIQSMLKLGRAQGVAFAAALHRKIPVVEYSPSKIKQSITGKGSASKEQVAAMLSQLLQTEAKPKFLDATDALAVAVCHYFQRKSLSGGKSYSGWDAFVKQNPNRKKS
ncbi:MAG: crossover junction endodeoxyribonuclease RuvC [Flavobacteriales bacterium]